MRWRGLSCALLLVASLAVAGCATTRQPAPGESAGQVLDPWENWNRKVFSFNESLDQNVLKPVATAYKNIVPELARTGVSNVFNNFADAWSAVNNLLQGKLEAGLSDTMRFTINTVFGIGGLFDVASEAGIEHHYEDLGQTFGHWGIGAGAYVVWPVLGPSTVRDSFALPLDRLATPALIVNDGRSQLGITLLQLINRRAELLGASQLLDEIALDKYSFVRDAYLARRRSLVYDGEPPERPDVPGPADSAAPAAAPASAPASAPTR
jgi:phospholipid-binding lipoprotein MlaA